MRNSTEVHSSLLVVLLLGAIGQWAIVGGFGPGGYKPHSNGGIKQSEDGSPSPNPTLRSDPPNYQGMMPSSEWPSRDPREQYMIEKNSTPPWSPNEPLPNQEVNPDLRKYPQEVQRFRCEPEIRSPSYLDYHSSLVKFKRSDDDERENEKKNMDWPSISIHIQQRALTPKDQLEKDLKKLLKECKYNAHEFIDRLMELSKKVCIGTNENR